MKTKGTLKKLSEDHFIIYDNSEIEVFDLFMHESHGKVQIKECEDIVGKSILVDNGEASCWIDYCKKITHSFGKPLVGVINRSLSEAEELIDGYSVEKMADKWSINTENVHPANSYIAKQGYLEGFNAHKELVKNKFIFTEQQLIELIERAREIKDGDDVFDLEGILGMLEVNTQTMDVEHCTSIINSLRPKTEWQVSIDENGKLKLAE